MVLGGIRRIHNFMASTLNRAESSLSDPHSPFSLILRSSCLLSFPPRVCVFISTNKIGVGIVSPLTGFSGHGWEVVIPKLSGNFP